VWWVCVCLFCGCFFGVFVCVVGGSVCVCVCVVCVLKETVS